MGRIAGGGRGGGTGRKNRGKRGDSEVGEDQELFRDEYELDKDQGDGDFLSLAGSSRKGGGASGTPESDEDELDEQNVLDVMGEDEDEEDEDMEEEDEDEDEDEEEDDMELTGYAAKLALQAKLLRSRPELRPDEDEEEGDEEEEEDGGVKWGNKKSVFYSADTVDYELASDDDELAPQEEEEEALRLQRTMEASLRPEDFEQDEDEEEDMEDGEEEEGGEGGDATLEEMSEGVKGKGKGKGARLERGMEMVKVARELGSGASDAERMSALESDIPELVALLSDLKAASSELQHKITPLLKQVQSGQYMTSKGLSYLESKHSLLLHYCCCLLFFLLLKAEGKPVKDHPVLTRLVELRLYLEKIRPIDKRLQYQLEKLLRLVGQGNSNAPKANGEMANGASAASEDALQFRPNPGNLVSKLQGEGWEDGGIGVYRPPKIAPVSMDGEDGTKRGSRVKSAPRKGDVRSAFLKELAEELEGRPEEIGERGVGRAGGVASSEMERQLAKLRQRAEAEESMFTRVPLKKDERKKLKALRREQHSSLGGMLEDFEDDVADLLAADEEGAEGGVPLDLLKKKKLSDAIAEAGQLNQLAMPKSRGLVSGDADLPSRPDLSERRRAFDSGFGSKKKRKAAEEAEDMMDGGDGGSEDLDGGDDDDEFYTQVREAKEAKKLAKKSSRPGLIPEDEPEVDGKRQISYQMEKNRGLTPHRSKAIKNPRKKYKLKHAKAVVRRKGQVRDVKTGMGSYGGESTGIKSKISRSVRMG